MSTDKIEEKIEERDAFEQLVKAFMSEAKLMLIGDYTVFTHDGEIEVDGVRFGYDYTIIRKEAIHDH